MNRIFRNGPTFEILKINTKYRNSLSMGFQVQLCQTVSIHNVVVFEARLMQRPFCVLCMLGRFLLVPISQTKCVLCRTHGHTKISTPKALYVVYSYDIQTLKLNVVADQDIIDSDSFSQVINVDVWNKILIRMNVKQRVQCFHVYPNCTIGFFRPCILVCS